MKSLLDKDLNRESVLWYILYCIVYIIKAGFVINEFNEHPNCNNRKLPGEFTIIADKIQ